MLVSTSHAGELRPARMIISMTIMLSGYMTSSDPRTAIGRAAAQKTRHNRNRPAVSWHRFVVVGDIAAPSSRRDSRYSRPVSPRIAARRETAHSAHLRVSGHSATCQCGDMFQFYAADGPQCGEQAAEIERYRARHRRQCRGQKPEDAPSPQVEALDMEDGRTRKISAKWRQQQQQQQVPVSNQFDDAGWADDAETHVGFNAFDFSASPEAFDGSEQQQGQSKAPAEPSQDNQQVEQEQEARNASLWERRRQQDGLGRQLPTLGQDALWGGPVHYATHDAQRRALYYQPQYYA